MKLADYQRLLLSAALVALAFVLGAFLRFERLAHDPLWHDEILSIVRMHGGNKAAFIRIENSNRTIAGDSIPSLIASSREGPVRGRAFMPGFYLFERIFSLPFKDIRIGAKVFPLVCGALLPLAVGLLVAYVTRSRFALLLATLLVALNPALIAYSVEARPYSSLLLAITVYLYLLIAHSAERFVGLVALGFVSLFGAVTHLLFLPIAWVGLVLRVFMFPCSRKEVHRVACVLVLATFVALPFVISVLATKEASHHFTSQITTTEGVMTGASETFGSFVGIEGAGLPAVSFAILVFCILVSVRKGEGASRVVVLTLLAPFLALLASDLALGGIRSTVPRYSLTAALGFCIVVAGILGQVWQGRRIVAVGGAALIVTLQLVFPYSIEEELKGGRYKELAWYTNTCGEQECLVLSTLPGNRSIEFAVNSFGRSELVPVGGYPSPSVIAQTRVARERGVPVLGVTPLDGAPPVLAGEDAEWSEVLVGGQTLVFRLLPREVLRSQSE